MTDEKTDRKTRILAELSRDGEVRTARLTGRLGVSEATLRRDLAQLERQGALHRVHGGAILAAAPPPPDPFAERMVLCAAEKERIGRAAAALIRPGDVIILDSGTTIFHFVRQLAPDLLERGPLTVITSSIHIIQWLSRWKGVNLIVLGGLYMPDYDFSVGPQAVATLSGLHADRVFFSCDGLTLSHGATVDNVLEAEVDRAMLQAASEVSLLTDSTKFGVIGLTLILRPDEIDTIVTDAGAPEETLEGFRARGAKIITA
jgi:DeoR/GlpR family transcriptional regulator of sugar metabolism